MSPRPDCLWTSQQIAQLCAGRAKGISFEQIADTLGCTKCAAVGKFDRLKAEGYAPALEIRPRLRASHSELIAEWMAENGGGIAQCARELGFSGPCVKGAWTRIKARYGAQAA